MSDSTSNIPVKNEQKAAVPHPWAGFDSLRNEIDRLFDDFHPLSLRFPFGRSRAPASSSAVSTWQIAPAVDVVEREKEYEITAELPGLDEKNVEVKLSNGMLTIKGEKKEEKEEKEKGYYLSERRYGSFQRSFDLPDGVDAERIDARFSNGVLSVRLPKSADVLKSEKKIDIKAG